jgi:hypothetical protein
MANINNVKDPYGLVQKAGKRRTYRRKRTLRRKKTNRRKTHKNHRK